MFNYIVGAVGLLLISPQLYALDVQAGRFFRVEHISLRNGKWVMPVEKRKYRNIRILDKDTFLLLGKCREKETCNQPLEDVFIKVESVRAVKTREDMWLADVSFSDKWEVTFLVFKNEKGFSVKKPKHFIFLDTALEKEVTHQIEQVLK